MPCRFYWPVFRCPSLAGFGCPPKIKERRRFDRSAGGTDLYGQSVRKPWNDGEEESPMSRHENIDWSECTLVETKPGVQSGSLVLRGTRLPVSAIVDNFDYGLTIAEISEQFEVPQESIRAIVTYVLSHRIAHSL